jgi:hypothetical protein
MPNESAEPQLPLPNDWPANIQAALLHVVALAQYALSHARGWASNCSNPRVRQQSEIDQRDQEIALLREEIRIKDARRTPAGLRPRYPPNALRSSKCALPAAGRWLKLRRFSKSRPRLYHRLPIVPMIRRSFLHELQLYRDWYNGERPHTTLKGATPDEKYFGRRAACQAPRFEPRPDWPRRSLCAKPQALIKGQPGVKLEVEIDFVAGRRHLPRVTLTRAA